ncbi:6872_t:CDS:10 [Acaulospora colombiana]|uniref:6872_t:CDS:1 n=1 Tax=Acaulospora colombiana TaxID=27376 RepID=A0ACA9L0B5_9GLOM|nr:6872_t:CDS:10 [Acaulospora colombiana]
MVFPDPDDQSRFQKETLFDGEVVNDIEEDGTVIVRLYVFDCLVDRTKNLMTRPLQKRLGVNTRSQTPHELEVEGKSQRFAVRAYHFDEIYKNLQTLKHGSDGLIFTALSAPYTIGTCETMLKWKPPTENSIDFKLKCIYLNGRPEHPDKRPDRFELHMNVGKKGYRYYDDLYVEDEWEEWREKEVIIDDRTSKRRLNLDGRIVEVFRDESKRWRFLRFRDDKSDGNYSAIVQKIIQSIEDGVTMEEDFVRFHSINHWKISYQSFSKMSLAPVQIFQDEATEERAENARLSSFIGAIAVGDLVKSTLGPKGMILQSSSNGDVMVTNDGATILKNIALDNAAAKVLVNISKVQDDEVGDGTTSVCVLAAELLREAENLVNQKIHPQTIIEGYRMASAAAYKALEASAIDNGADPEAFRKDLINIARTTLSSKVLSQDKDYFAKLAVDAVLRLKGSTNLEHIQIIKKCGGRLMDSYLDEGFILDKKIGVNQPKRIENAKILIANTPMDTDKIKIFGARVRVDSTGKLAELERAERDKMKEKVEKIKAHGINCFVNRQLIYNWPEQLFADAGIISIEHADFDGVERLALVTGSEITSTFDHPELVKLGHCDLIEEVIIGEDKLLKFSGVAAGEACTIVLRGATNQLLDEAERSLHDALSVLTQTVKETRTVFGGGCAEMLMSKAVDELSAKTAGKKAIAMESFAKALRQIPTILADNAGYDSADLVARLRAAHYEGKSTCGLNMSENSIGDMREIGVTESYKLKRQVLLSASEAAEMILRVDDIIRCAPRRREQ